MDPFWDPPIRCVGRRYPNGPYGAMMGATRRPWPHWLAIEMPFAGHGYWPPLGTLTPLRFLGATVVAQRVIDAEWHWNNGAPLPSQMNFFVERGAVPNITARLRATKLGNPLPVFVEYFADLGNGYRSVEETIHMNRTSFSGAWTLPNQPPETIEVLIATYDMMPAGRCIAP